MATTIRPMTEADYAGMAALANLVYEDSISAENIRWQIANKDPRCLYGCLVAEEAGAMVGFAQFNQWPGAYHPQKFEIEIIANPGHRCRGVGSALYERIMAELERYDPISVNTTTREDWPDSLRFVAARGFTEVMRSWESILSVPEADLAPWEPVEQRVAALGYEIRSFNELAAADPECRQKLYALVMETRRDVPMFEPLTDVPYEQWLKNLENPHFWGDGYFVALKDGQWVGLSALWHTDAADELSTGLTAVHRDHRGIGLAKALKARAIRTAKEAGYRKIKTFNESTNQRMLSINIQMGFKRKPAWIAYRRQIRAEE